MPHAPPLAAYPATNPFYHHSRLSILPEQKKDMTRWGSGPNTFRDLERSVLEASQSLVKSADELRAAPPAAGGLQVSQDAQAIHDTVSRLQETLSRRDIRCRINQYPNEIASLARALQFSTHVLSGIKIGPVPFWTILGSLPLKSLRFWLFDLLVDSNFYDTIHEVRMHCNISALMVATAFAQFLLHLCRNEPDYKPWEPQVVDERRLGLHRTPMPAGTHRAINIEAALTQGGFFDDRDVLDPVSSRSVTVVQTSLAEAIQHFKETLCELKLYKEHQLVFPTPRWKEDRTMDLLENFDNLMVRAQSLHVDVSHEKEGSSPSRIGNRRPRTIAPITKLLTTILTLVVLVVLVCILSIWGIWFNVALVVGMLGCAVLLWPLLLKKQLS